MNNRKYWIETYGCQMNKAESGALEYQLQRNGWKRSGCDVDADVVILNTCSVRKTAETRIWGRIGHFKHVKKKRPFKLVLIGCMAERLKEEFFKQSPCVDIVIGNFQKHIIADICDSIHQNGQKHLYANKDTYLFSDVHHQSGIKAFIPIMNGCNNFCSYCIVPYVRGSEVSRHPDQILREISHLDEKGVREITLLGQNVNSYRYDYKGSELDFTALLELIIPVVRNIEWIRFLTSHPKDVPQKLIQLIAESPSLCRHIHLPVQHGSDHILKLMKRGYTSGDYRNLVEQIKKYISGMSLTTDILIGFPNETEQDFKSTLKLMEEIEFDDAFMYRYNKREGTGACTLGDTVPEEIKLERLKIIIQVQRKVSEKKKKQKCGQKVKVLVEGVSKKNKGELLGRTEKDEMVVFAGQKKQIGSFATVRLLSLKGNTFWGKEIL